MPCWSAHHFASGPSLTRPLAPGRSMTNGCQSSAMANSESPRSLSCATFSLFAFGIVRASARIVVQSKVHPWLAARESFADVPLPLKATPSLAVHSQADQHVAASAALPCAALVLVQTAFQLA